MRKLINCHHVKKPLLPSGFARPQMMPLNRLKQNSRATTTTFALMRFLPLSLMCLLIISDFQEQIANQYAQYSYDRKLQDELSGHLRSSQLLLGGLPISKSLGQSYKIEASDRFEARSRPFILLAAANPDENRLYEDLMMTYNRIVRPVQNNTERLLVRLSLKLSQLIDVNLKNQMMTTNVWLNQEWSDYKLKWDPSEYGGIEDINLPAEQIWLPDIALYNSAEGNFVVSIMTKAKVRYNGLVTWNPPAIFRSSCQIDITYFPFDSQTCHLKFGSWTFGTKIELRHINDTEIIERGTDLSEYYQNVEWDIMQASARRNVITYICCPNDFYEDVTFNFTLRRKPLFYTVNLILPCVGITILSFLVFYLPSDSGEKVTLTISILVSLIFFLSVLIETIPSTSLAMPLLGKYIVFTMILITVSVCATVCVLNIHFRTPSTHSMPPWIKRWCIDTLPKYLFMNVPQYQSQQASTILPEQLIYMHNQAYATQTPAQINWTNSVKVAAQSAKLANNYNAASNPSSIPNSNSNLKTSRSNLIANHQLNPNSLDADLMNLNPSPTSHFLPYLQSEAARRLKMQRSRISDRSTSDAQTSKSNTDTNNENNNCDIQQHQPSPRAETTVTMQKDVGKQSLDNKLKRKVSNRDLKTSASESKGSWFNRLIPFKSSNSREEEASENEIEATNEALQQDTSSSFENDYQYHNHFQARASVCSTNLWRVGPSRRCSVIMPPNYPTFYQPQLVLPDAKPGQINTLSGRVSALQQAQLARRDRAGGGFESVVRNATGSKLAVTQNRSLSTRFQPNLAKQVDEQEMRQLNAEGFIRNPLPLLNQQQQQPIVYSASRPTIPKQQHQEFMPTPPPPLPPNGSMLMMNIPQSAGNQMFLRTSNQQRQANLAGMHPLTCAIANQSQQSLNQTSSSMNHNAYSHLNLASESQCRQQSTVGIVGQLQNQHSNQFQNLIASSNLPQQFLPKSKSTDHQLCSHANVGDMNQPRIYLANQEQFKRLGLNIAQAQSQLCQQRSRNQLCGSQTLVPPNPVHSSLGGSYYAQKPQNIGRALGQAYVQRLQRQPTIYSLHSSNVHQPSGSLHQEALLRPLDNFNIQNARSQQSFDRMRRSKSQSSLDKRAKFALRVDCEQCNSFHRPESNLRLDNETADCQCNSFAERQATSSYVSQFLNGGGSIKLRAKNCCADHQVHECCNVSGRWCNPSANKQASFCNEISLDSRSVQSQNQPPPLNTLSLMKLISEVDKAIQNAMFIAQHIDNLDEFESVKENWKYIAMVIDRIFLIVFLFACIVGTVTIFAMVPWSHYTIEKPIDLQLTRLLALNLTGDEPYTKTCKDF